MNGFPDSLFSTLNFDKLLKQNSKNYKYIENSNLELTIVMNYSSEIT